MAHTGSADNHPRRYDDAIRLNIAAIAEEFGIGPSTFRTRQSTGWHHLGGGRLPFELRSWHDARGRKRWEQTFVLDEVREALGPPADAADGLSGTPEARRFSRERVRRELRVGDSTLRRWEKKYPALGGRPLRGQWEKSLVTGRWAKTYAKAETDRIKAHMAAPRAERPSKQPPASTESRSPDPNDPRLGLIDAAEYCGCSCDTLLKYETDCPLLEAGSLVPIMERSRRGRKPWRRTYRTADLDPIKAALAAPEFDGYYHGRPEGTRLNMQAAGREPFHFSIRRLQRYMQRCPYLPTGKLESVKLRPPVKGRKKEHTFLHRDLARIKAAEREELADERNPERFKNWRELLEHYGCPEPHEQFDLWSVLRDLRDRRLLQPYPRVRTIEGKRCRSLVYDLEEVDRLLRTYDPESANGEGSGSAQPAEQSNTPPPGNPEETTDQAGKNSADRGRGRPAGVTLDRADRLREAVLKDHRAGKYATVADLARAHGISRSRPSQIINGWA